MADQDTQDFEFDISDLEVDENSSSTSRQDESAQMSGTQPVAEEMDWSLGDLDVPVESSELRAETITHSVEPEPVSEMSPISSIPVENEQVNPDPILPNSETSPQSQPSAEQQFSNQPVTPNATEYKPTSRKPVKRDGWDDFADSLESLIDDVEAFDATQSATDAGQYEQAADKIEFEAAQQRAARDNQVRGVSGNQPAGAQSVAANPVSQAQSSASPPRQASDKASVQAPVASNPESEPLQAEVSSQAQPASNQSFTPPAAPAELSYPQQAVPPQQPAGSVPQAPVDQQNFQNQPPAQQQPQQNYEPVPQQSTPQPQAYAPAEAPYYPPQQPVVQPPAGYQNQGQEPSRRDPEPSPEDFSEEEPMLDDSLVEDLVEADDIQTGSNSDEAVEIIKDIDGEVETVLDAEDVEISPESEGDEVVEDTIVEDSDVSNVDESEEFEDDDRIALESAGEDLEDEVGADGILDSVLWDNESDEDEIAEEDTASDDELAAGEETIPDDQEEAILETPSSDAEIEPHGETLESSDDVESTIEGTPEDLLVQEVEGDDNLANEDSSEETVEDNSATVDEAEGSVDSSDLDEEASVDAFLDDGEAIDEPQNDEEFSAEVAAGVTADELNSLESDVSEDGEYAQAEAGEDESFDDEESESLSSDPEIEPVSEETDFEESAISEDVDGSLGEAESRLSDSGEGESSEGVFASEELDSEAEDQADDVFEDGVFEDEDVFSDEIETKEEDAIDGAEAVSAEEETPDAFVDPFEQEEAVEDESSLGVDESEEIDGLDSVDVFAEESLQEESVVEDETEAPIDEIEDANEDAPIEEADPNEGFKEDVDGLIDAIEVEGFDDPFDEGSEGETSAEDLLVQAGSILNGGDLDPIEVAPDEENADEVAAIEEDDDDEVVAVIEEDDDDAADVVEMPSAESLLEDAKAAAASGNVADRAGDLPEPPEAPISLDEDEESVEVADVTDVDLDNMSQDDLSSLIAEVGDDSAEPADDPFAAVAEEDPFADSNDDEIAVDPFASSSVDDFNIDGDSADFDILSDEESSAGKSEESDELVAEAEVEVESISKPEAEEKSAEVVVEKVIELPKSPLWKRLVKSIPLAAAIAIAGLGWVGATYKQEIVEHFLGYDEDGSLLSDSVQKVADHILADFDNKGLYRMQSVESDLRHVSQNEIRINVLLAAQLNENLYKPTMDNVLTDKFPVSQGEFIQSVETASVLFPEMLENVPELSWGGLYELASEKGAILKLRVMYRLLRDTVEEPWELDGVRVSGYDGELVWPEGKPRIEFGSDFRDVSSPETRQIAQEYSEEVARFVSNVQTMKSSAHGQAMKLAQQRERRREELMDSLTKGAFFQGMAISGESSEKTNEVVMIITDTMENGSLIKGVFKMKDGSEASKHFTGSVGFVNHEDDVAGNLRVTTVAFDDVDTEGDIPLFFKPSSSTRLSLMTDGVRVEGDGSSVSLRLAKNM